VIVIGVWAVTDEVVMVKFGDVVLPAATVTLAGTCATAGSELASEITAPPAPAAAFRVTRFEVVEVPPRIEAGDSVMLDTNNGFTVSVALVELEL
jgi:hypothetical protein